MDDDHRHRLPGDTSTTPAVTPRERERRRQFAAALAKLAIQLRLNDPDKVTMAAYWDVLHVLPMRAIEVACATLARTAQYFPTSAEIYKAAAQSMHADQQEMMRTRSTPLHRYDCDVCSDTKRTYHECPGREAPTCGRTTPHLPHDFVRPCPTCAPQQTPPPAPAPHDVPPHWQETNDD